jgi:predicted nucleic acid-binding protein
VTVSAALADTSLYIAHEQRGLPTSAMPGTLAVSVITVGELRMASSLPRMPTFRQLDYEL